MDVHTLLRPADRSATAPPDLSLSGDGHPALGLPLAQVSLVHEARRASETCDGLRPILHNTAGRADHAPNATDSCFTNL